MKQDCKSCSGTGRCPQCKGTGHFGYPGFGKTDHYPAKCVSCSNSGVCRACHGKGRQ